MINYFLLSTVATLITWVLYIPFINFLYRMKMQEPFLTKGRMDAFGKTTEVFNMLKSRVAGTPTGGGVLVVIVVAVMFSVLKYYYAAALHAPTFNILFAGLVIFSIIGVLDDLKKVFTFKGWGLRARHKLLIQLVGGSFIAYLGVISRLFVFYIPGIFGKEIAITAPVPLFLVSLFIIVFMSNAFNILDGIDGLSAGSLLITLATISVFMLYISTDLSTSVFMALLFGATLAYLYFNVNPARVFMGDAGALSFGAIIGIISLLLGVSYLLPLFGLVYIADACSSLLQWASRYLRNGKKIFKIAPMHHHFEAIGWSGTKVVFRFWVFHLFFSILALGVFFAFR